MPVVGKPNEITLIVGSIMRSHLLSMGKFLPEGYKLTLYARYTEDKDGDMLITEDDIKVVIKSLQAMLDGPHLFKHGIK